MIEIFNPNDAEHSARRAQAALTAAKAAGFLKAQTTHFALAALPVIETREFDGLLAMIDDPTLSRLNQCSPLLPVSGGGE